MLVFSVSWRCLALFLLQGPRLASACTSIAVGRKATADGSVIIGQSEDGDDLADPRIVYVPARDYPEGAKAPVWYTDGPFPRWVVDDLGPGYKPNHFTGTKLTTPIGHIPQVEHTFAYWDSNYAIINEHNVAMDESTCSAMFHTCAKGDLRNCEAGRTQGEALLDSRMLTMFGLERAKTAREAVQIMGDLAYKYGFYGTHDANGDGESLMVGDPTEAWVFHILADPTGKHAIWAAVRVPDDGFTVVSNAFTIRDINVEDSANCLASPNIYSVAEEFGWWKPGEVLDFTKVYGNGEYGNKFYAGRRMWRAMSLVAPSQNLSPTYTDLRTDRTWPWAVRPDKPVSLEDVLSIYRDWYAGTPFDMTKGLAAGFGGTPDRFDTKTKVPGGGWERTIALYRTQTIKVQHLLPTTEERPREAAGVAWIANGPGHYAPFLPVPSGLNAQLSPLFDVEPKSFTRSSLNWAARKVMMTSQIRFDHMHPTVEKEQLKAERIGADRLALATAAWARTGDQKAFNEVFEAHAGEVLAKWSQLSEDLLLAYSDNSDISRVGSTPVGAFGAEENTAPLSYPPWWLAAVGYFQGPPLPPPMVHKCWPNCTPEAHAKEIADAAIAEPLAAHTVSVGGLSLLSMAMLSVGCVLALGAFRSGCRTHRRAAEESLLEGPDSRL